jgi:predicted DNA-binding transcriptional regulator YafY
MKKTAAPENNHQACKKTGQGDESSRMSRLLTIVREIRNDNHQSLENLIKYLQISRSQFYKDREELAANGFSFAYSKTKGFEIMEDKLLPLTDLTLSDRLALMFALEHLSVTGDSHLIAQTMTVARKLAGGLDEPFKSQLLQCYNHRIIQQTFAVQPQLLDQLQDFISKGQRVKIFYTRAVDWTTRWRELEPRRIYLRQKTLYLYARAVDETPPKWKVFRLSRIQEIQPTGMYFTFKPKDDDGFQMQMNNAFETFLGTQVKPVSIKFHRHAAPFIREKQWHHSQKITELPEGELILSLRVAEPQEVLRWARQFDKDAKQVEEPTSA